ncbi:MAG: 4-hydroxy-tetrahydrodipicolinate synthase [Planctomycetota bacterium]|nr:MAG: 4-hydroxy-tetrahydrodipicolinate synthase [Planctomycetota bacterium]
MMRGGPPMQGSMTALVTPFRDGRVDEACLARLVERQIEGGTDWLVPCGTTGESPTLSEEEHDRVIDVVIGASRGRRPVLAGAGSNCTEKAVKLSKKAAAAGASGILSVVPYYNRPTQEGLYRHFAAVAEAVELPIVLYNVPLRTGQSLANETVVRLRNRYSNVVALKHATGSVGGVDDLQAQCDIIVLSGDDSITWPLMALGARGVISVISNLVPAWMKELVDAALRGEGGRALACHRKLADLADGIGRFGPNPQPIKTAMALCGLLSDEFRLPLCSLDAKAKGEIAALLKKHEIG